MHKTLDRFQEERDVLLNEFKNKIQDFSEKLIEANDQASAKDKQISDYKKLIDELTIKVKSGGKEKVVSDQPKGVQKLKEELEMYKTECTELSERLEHAQEDQKLFNGHYKTALEGMADKCAKLEEDLKNKEEALMRKEGEMSGFKASVYSLTEENK